ncbi:MAG TPA: hypothetical protein ENN05_01040 [Deltaproteobacteria bacterium]|nr:hypothetical protein [Deltaproteobacteria bacterium]
MGRSIMKRCFVTLIACFLSTAVFAAGPEVIWVGGGMKVSDEAKPRYTAETLISLGQSNSMYLFTEPMILVKNGKLGLDLGVGARLPIMSGEAIVGYNMFFDYTRDNNHKRVGAGLEFFHSNFSGHLNLYLPISDDHNWEEALPGVDLTLGIPIPNASFISIWPSLYYYDGRDRKDMKGIGLEVRIQPVQAAALIIGGRNDTHTAGREDSEIYAKLEVTIPMRRLGKDLFAFNKGQYPIDINTYMGHRVVRESSIAYENKRWWWWP